MRTNKFIVLKSLTVTIALLLMGMFMSGCSNEAAPTNPTNENESGTLSKRGPWVHSVSVGGPDVDFAGPGGDGNFSLVAKEYADGSVKGQWQDSFGHGNGGIHITVDCIKVVDNWAIVGGVITHGSSGDDDFSGLYAITAVVDNGTSANDPADQISFSWFPAIDVFGTEDCTELTLDDFVDNAGNEYLFDFTQGQVKVKHND